MYTNKLKHLNATKIQNIHLIFGELAFIQASGEYGGIILTAYMGWKSP